MQNDLAQVQPSLSHLQCHQPLKMMIFVKGRSFDLPEKNRPGRSKFLRLIAFRTEEIDNLRTGSVSLTGRVSHTGAVSEAPIDLKVNRLLDLGANCRQDL
jgi:hypothetical protein